MVLLLTSSVRGNASNLSLRVLLLFLFLLLTLSPLPASAAFDLYCGDESCYEVLQLSSGRLSTASQVKKAYYRLSLLYHPDKVHASSSSPPTEAEKTAASVHYQRIVTAYEVLSDSASRENYHSFLDNPHLFSHHLRYYQHRIRAAQVSAWKVVASLLLLLTILHYLYIHHRFRAVRRTLASHPSIQAKMLVKVKKDLMEELGRIDQAQIPRRVLKEEDNIAAYVHITGSEAQQPTLHQLFPLELVRWSARTVRDICWGVKLLVYHEGLGMPYGEEEREWATARALKLSWSRWRSTIDEEERKELVKRELWKKKQLEAFILEKKKEMAGQKRSWR